MIFGVSAHSPRRAFAPISQGMLTGKYKVGASKPDGPRSFTFTDDKLRRAEPLLGLMNEIGTARGVRFPFL